MESKARDPNEQARKRLKVLGGTGLATNRSQLKRVLDVLKELPTVDLQEALGSTTWDLDQAVRLLWSQVGCEIELEQKPGKGNLKLACVSITKAMQVMVSKYPEFHSRLLELWNAKPCTRSEPYSLLVYGDELVPGNVLALETTRKTFGCQACIKDFGASYVSNNSSWIPLFCVRHSIAAHAVPGGLSYIFRQYLRHLFLTEKIGEKGITVPLRTNAGNHVVLYFKISNLLADGDALRMLTNWKGAGGKLPCFACLNVLNVKDEADVPDGFVTLACANKNRFAKAKNEDWWWKADELRADALRVAANTMSKAAFKKKETALGLTYNEKGVLWDRELRKWYPPVDVCTIDGMHTMLVDGVGQNEMRCVLGRLRDLGDRKGGNCGATRRIPRMGLYLAKMLGPRAPRAPTWPPWASRGTSTPPGVSAPCQKESPFSASFEPLHLRLSKATTGAM